MGNATLETVRFNYEVFEDGAGRYGCEMHADHPGIPPVFAGGATPADALRSAQSALFWALSEMLKLGELAIPPDRVEFTAVAAAA